LVQSQNNTLLSTGRRQLAAARAEEAVDHALLDAQSLTQRPSGTMPKDFSTQVRLIQAHVSRPLPKMHGDTNESSSAMAI